MRKPDKAFAMINYLEDQLLAGAYTAGQRMPSLRARCGNFRSPMGPPGASSGGYFLKISGRLGMMSSPLRRRNPVHILSRRGKTSWAGTHQSV